MAASNGRLDSEDDELTGQASLQSIDDTQPYSGPPTLPKPKSALQRMGVRNVSILIGTLVLLLAVIGFVTFLWTAVHENSFWRLIIVKGWAGGAVTVSALLLRMAIGLQAGVAVAMLAAVSLETGRHLLLSDTAQISKLRAGRAMPLDIVLPYMRSMRLERWLSLRTYLRVSVVLVFITTTMLLQLTSTMLVSDLSVGFLPGAPSTNDLDFDFAYQIVGGIWSWPEQARAVSTWLRNAVALPTFAEFSEPILAPDTVDDTGTLFRSFLPFQDAQSRESISEYSGKALVLDARVSCQRPQFRDLLLRWENEGWNLIGYFKATENVQRLHNFDSWAPFNCTVGNEILVGYTMSICQSFGASLGGGILLSESRDFKQSFAESRPGDYDDGAGGSYLIFNTTRGSSHDSGNVPITSGHGAWTDLEYQYTSGYNSSYYANTSVSLCYPAFWIARLDVTLRSARNRTEPTALYRGGDRWYRTEPDIHVQMGEVQRDHELLYVRRTSNLGNRMLTTVHRTPESRGILRLLPKDSWLPTPSDSAQYNGSTPFVVTSAKVEAEFGLTEIYPRNPCLTWKIRNTIVKQFHETSPDPTISSIFTTSLRVTNGSAATALSTIITILSSMAYYDQLPNFETTAHNVSTTYYEPFVFPQSFRGYAAVLATTTIHCLLIMLITVTFITSTHLTTLGDHWQSISQVVSPATEEFLKKSSRATDKEVRRGLKAEHREHEIANLRVLPDGDGRVGLVARKAYRRHSHDMSLE